MTGQHDLGGSPAGPMDYNDQDAPSWKIIYSD